MSEKEKSIIKELSLTMSLLKPEKQYYVLGIAEGMAISKEEKNKEKAQKGE